MNVKKFLHEVFHKDSKGIANAIGKKHFDEGGEVSPWEQAKSSLPDTSHFQEVSGINFQDPNPVNYAIGAGRVADAYTGAPVRAALGAMGRGQSGAEAYGQQFGENPDKAPTGEQLMEQAGVENSIGKTLGGIGLDIGADPTNFIPTKGLAGLLAIGALKKGKAGLETGEVASKIAKGAMAKRLENAEKMGFDTSKEWYHGTKGDIQAFDPESLGGSTNAGSAKQGFFFASSPETASDYSAAANDLSGRIEERPRGLKLLNIEEDLKSLKRSTPEQNKEYRDHVISGLQNLQDELSGKVVRKYPRPKDYLIEKIEGYKQKLEDANYSLTPEYEKERLDTIARLQSQVNLANQSKELGNKEGANVLPVYLKYKNPLVHDFKGQPYRDVKYGELMQQAKENGHDAVIFKNTYDPAFIGGGTSIYNEEPQDIIAVFKPEQIRSKFAGFNPKKAKSGNITAGIGAATAAGAAASKDNE